MRRAYFPNYDSSETQERYENDTPSGLRVLDTAYMNTAAITSKITYIDGLKGVLRHRGYAIEDLAEKSDFLETAYLLVLSRLDRLLNARFTASSRRKIKMLFSEEKSCRILTLQTI